MRLYRPSNGTEAELFFEKFCYGCKHYVEDETTGSMDCNLNIILAAEINNFEDPNFPDEWRYDENGTPTCTNFQQIDST